MRRPRLTFACELDARRLGELFADGSVIDQLRALDARVTMMVSDFSDERAGVVERLNDAGVPVLAVPLFPEEEGYYFTVGNADRAEARYAQWQAWSREHVLRWDGIGLDIEPDAKLYEQIMKDPRRLPAMLLSQLRDRHAAARARASYASLVERIRRDGWLVENYQFPLVADERAAGSTFLQRLLGLVDVRTDREVWMLYTSFARTIGPGILWAYGPHAEAIAVGTTGGGPDIEGHPQMPALSWDEFARDLRLAAHWTDEVYVHSLEGCVWQGFLERLRDFGWDPADPPRTAAAGAAMRRLLRAVLWSTAHGRRLVLAALAAATVLRWARR